MLEAGIFGVPVIVLPFFGDQFRNGRVAERNGWGRGFNKVELLHGSKEFVAVIEELVSNERYFIMMLFFIKYLHFSYKTNARRTSNLIKSKPFSAEEKLLKWTEFVVENGGQLPELQIEGRNLSIIVYHNLDIFIPLVILIGLISVGGIYLSYMGFKKVLEFGSEYRKIKTN